MGIVCFIIVAIIFFLIIRSINRFGISEHYPMHTYESDDETFHIKEVESTSTSSPNSMPSNSVYTVNTSIQMHTYRDDTTYEPLALPDISGHIRFHEYKVKGKNPDTNRMQTKSIVVAENTPESEIVSISALLPPVTVSTTFDSGFDSPPTEYRLELAKEFNIPIIPSLTDNDLLCLIGKQKNYDSMDLASNNIRLLLAKHKAFTSPYCGYKYALTELFNYLSVKEKLSFWCYLVYCSLSNQQIDIPETSPYHQVFSNFAEECIQNHEMTKAIIKLPYNTIEQYIFQKKIDRRYKTSKVYDYTKNFLVENHLIEL